MGKMAQRNIGDSAVDLSFDLYQAVFEQGVHAQAILDKNVWSLPMMQGVSNPQTEMGAVMYSASWWALVDARALMKFARPRPY